MVVERGEGLQDEMKHMFSDAHTLVLDVDEETLKLTLS
jgi:hypothetical protein